MLIKINMKIVYKDNDRGNVNIIFMYFFKNKVYFHCLGQLDYKTCISSIKTIILFREKT